MAIIIVGGQKGGTGKSTTACNLAALLSADSDILLVDADRQTTSSLWIAERKRSYPKLHKINAAQRYGDIDDALLDFGERYEHLIVDAAGHDSTELRSSLTVCDILLMPFRPSQPDLDTLPYMSTLIKTHKRVNPKLKTFAFINSAPTNIHSKDILLASAAIEEYTEINMLPTVYDRRIYRDAMSEGLGVVEMPEKSDSANSAKREIRKLWEALSEAI